jgi:membrane fusion protein (multidrug efflux system)
MGPGCPASGTQANAGAGGSGSFRRRAEAAWNHGIMRDIFSARARMGRVRLFSHAETAVARDTDTGARGPAETPVRERRPEHDDGEARRPTPKVGDDLPDRAPPAGEVQASRPPESRARPFYKRPLPLALMALAALVVVVLGTAYWLYARQYVSTDDAFIDANVVRLAPRVAGQVLRVPVSDNQEVQKGQLVVELDPAPFQVQLDQAKASEAQAEGQLAAARSQVAVAKANADQAAAEVGVAQADAANAEDSYQRLQNLKNTAQNLVVTDRELEDARAQDRSAGARFEAARKQAVAASAQVDATQKQIDIARAALASAKAKVEQAQLELSYTRVTAPQPGRVTHRGVEVGDYVDVGQALLALVPDQVWVTANFKETELTDMRPGQPVTISVDAYPDHELHGHVDSIQAGTGARFSLLPPQNATGNYVKVVQRVPVKIVFDRLPDDLLLGPGMSVVPEVKVR